MGHLAVGYLSHPIADLPFGELVAGTLESTASLIWPLLPPPPYETEPSFVAHLVAYELGPYEGFQIVLFGLATALWSLDGRPGWEAVSNRVERLLDHRR